MKICHLELTLLVLLLSVYRQRKIVSNLKLVDFLSYPQLELLALVVELLDRQLICLQRLFELLVVLLAEEELQVQITWWESGLRYSKVV